MRLLISFNLILISVLSVRAANSADDNQVLVRVDGQTISAADLEFAYISRRIPVEAQAAVRDRFLKVLIDKKLLAAYLLEKKIKPNQEEVDAQVIAIIRALRSRGDDPEQVFKRLGYDNGTLRQEFALPSAWNAYAKLVITQKDLLKFWERNQQKFDGTKLEASHIVKRLPKGGDQATKDRVISELKAVRTKIMDGQSTFANAAVKHSDAPSKSKGGQLGKFRYAGRMPTTINETAFSLNENDISEPFETRFGIHILTVTKRFPGDLSLEDVRSNVFKALSIELQNEVIREARKTAKIEFTESK